VRAWLGRPQCSPSVYSGNPWGGGAAGWRLSVGVEAVAVGTLPD